jgi:ppGpp synthetase/RelA/SpoT-type nucleotidyltranferase
MKIDRSWHRRQIEQYRKEHAVYAEYAETLRRILEAACRIHASLAVVQVRAKSLSSFGEKAVRKAHKYSHPVTQLTDLCGARVITTNLDEAHRICGFINEHFDVDRPNSLDVRTRLRSSEFGYLSYHYVVRAGEGSILGIPVPKILQGRKAEIQVRTLLQHAWASITHDRVYKSQFKVPDLFRRNLARLAALLEGADQEFDAAVRRIEAYKLHYGAYMSPAQMEDEIETLRMILKNEPEEGQKPGIALRIAHIAKAAWDWKTVVETLQPYIGLAIRERREIRIEHGHALCRLSCRSSRGRTFARGQKELAEASNGAEGRLRAEALGHLAWSFSQIPGRERKAAELYRRAYELAPDDPYLLCLWLEFETAGRKRLEPLALNRQTILSALETCRAHVDAGIELPWAFFSMGKLHMMLGEPYESFAAYAHAIHLLMTENPGRLAELLACESAGLAHFGATKALDPGRTWAADLVLLAKAALEGRPTRMPPFPKKAGGKATLREAVIIIAGESRPASKAKHRDLRLSLTHALRDFSGTVISGGTAQGIPGMVGAIAAALRGGNRKKFGLVGYVPKTRPLGVAADRHYDELVMTPSSDFSVEQPFRYWKDILASGITPGSVRLLAIGGGPITKFECRLALALGATVGIVASKGVMPNGILDDAEGWKEGRLLVVPEDRHTLRAFLNPGGSALSGERIDKLGEAIHDNFLAENRQKSTDPAMAAWADLRQDLKDSNRQQAVHMEDALRQAGFALRPATARPSPPRFSAAEVELMAEIEHGRWNVERLRSGWRYGPRRDVANKLSPYLVPWPALPENIKDYDRGAVRNWAKILGNCGMEIYRLRHGPATTLKRSSIVRNPG